MTRKALIFVGYNMLAIFVMLVCAEIIIRVSKPEIGEHGTTREIISDSLYYETHGLKALAQGRTNGALVSVDQYGFRNTTIPVDKAKKCRLLIGDSVTFGIGVEDNATFGAILNAAIDSINFVNPSASVYNIDSYIDIFKKLVVDNPHGLQYSGVVIFWCLNDVYSTIPDLQMPGGKMRSIFSDFLTVIRIHSRLYHFFKKIFFDRPKTYFEFDLIPYKEGGSDFQQAVHKICILKELSEQAGLIFDLVLAPYEHQLSQGNFLPQEVFGNAVKACGVEVYDPFKNNKLKGFAAEEFYLYGDGIHFSALGHREFAQALLRQGFK